MWTVLSNVQRFAASATSELAAIARNDASAKGSASPEKTFSLMDLPIRNDLNQQEDDTVHEFHRCQGGDGVSSGSFRPGHARSCSFCKAAAQRHLWNGATPSKGWYTRPEDILEDLIEKEAFTHECHVSDAAKKHLWGRKSSKKSWITPPELILVDLVEKVISDKVDKAQADDSSVLTRLRAHSDSLEEPMLNRVGSLRQRLTRRLSLPVTRREKKGKCFVKPLLEVPTLDEDNSSINKESELCQESQPILSPNKPFYEHRRDSTVDINPSPLIMFQDNIQNDFEDDDDVFMPSSNVYQPTTTGLVEPSGQREIMHDALDGLFTKASKEYHRWT